MALPSRPVVVRLPDELARKFDRIRGEFAGLQPSVVLRMLIAGQLDRPIDEQIELITAQIRKPGAKPPIKAARHSLNASRPGPGE